MEKLEYCPNCGEEDKAFHEYTMKLQDELVCDDCASGHIDQPDPREDR